jgi:hypothetical protein
MVYHAVPSSSASEPEFGQAIIPQSDSSEALHSSSEPDVSAFGMQTQMNRNTKFRAFSNITKNSGGLGAPVADLKTALWIKRISQLS